MAVELINGSCHFLLIDIHFKSNQNWQLELSMIQKRIYADRFSTSIVIV